MNANLHLNSALEVIAGLEEARALIPWTKREILPIEAAALYILASQAQGTIIELGTCLGYSAAVMGVASPESKITTTNPKKGEQNQARGYLRPLANVTALGLMSWDLLDCYRGEDAVLVFVDGDHGQVARDFAWWDRIKAGGLMLFHDYAPKGSPRPCQPVFEALNALREGLGRDFDVRYKTLAGWYKQRGERLPMLDIRGLRWGYDPETKWTRYE